MDRIGVRLVIHGRVHGVGYRVWASEQAHRLGLEGWVRNRIDGTVELVAAGRASDVEALVAACRYGPPAAAVASIDRLEAPDETLEGFELRPTS